MDCWQACGALRNGGRSWIGMIVALKGRLASSSPFLAVVDAGGVFYGGVCRRTEYVKELLMDRNSIY